MGARDWQMISGLLSLILWIVLSVISLAKGYKFLMVVSAFLLFAAIFLLMIGTGFVDV